MASQADAIAVSGTPDHSIWRVILASSVGTMNDDNPISGTRPPKTPFRM